MSLSAIKEIYIESSKQFLSSWMKLLAWNGIWALCCVIVALGVSNWVLQIAMGVAGTGSILLFVFLLMVFSVISWAFGLYSLLGIAHETEQDPDCSWGLCGIQGFLHPLKSLGISAGSLVLSFVFSLVITGVAFLIPLIGSAAIIILLAILVGWVFLGMFICMACYAQLDNESFAPLASYQRAMDILKRNAFKSFGLFAPVMVVCMLFFGGSVSLWVSSQESRWFDLGLAMEAKVIIENNQTLPESERRFTVFSQKPPEYNGNFDNYIEEMAKYAFLYEGYRANIEKRSMSEKALTYRDAHPVNHPARVLFSFLLGCLGVGGVAFGSVLLLQIFRRRSEEYEKYLEEHKFEFEETEDDKKKMAMLKEHLKDGEKSKSGKGTEEVHKEPELIMKKRASVAGVELDANFNINNINVDNIDNNNADNNKAEGQIPSDQPAFVFEKEKKDNSIDMNFSLDVDALAQKLEAETGGDGKKRKRAHNSIMEYYDDLAAAQKEEPIFDKGAGSLCSTLDSLLEGFSKDDIK